MLLGAPLAILGMADGAAVRAQATGGGDGNGNPARVAAPPTPLRLDAGHAPGDLRVDGALDEAAWRSAPPAAGFVQHRPDEGRPATQATEVRVLVDDDALWVGALLRDDEPDRIVARLGRRDDPVQADWFTVYVDGYHDRRTAFAFGVSAAGVQRDLRVSDGGGEDAGWDAVWQSAVRRTADGWTVELRIPLSQLRFNATGDPRAAWGLNFARTLARRDEVSHWAPIPQGSATFVARFGELAGVAGLEPPARVEIVPYAVARLTREPGAADDPFHAPSRGFGSVGADVRVGLGSSLTLSATLNPDFGQVEADPAVLNLSAYETLQEERRPFFVEGSDIFGLAFPSWPPFFYSRRIGRAPQGPSPAGAVYTDRPAASTILGAVKLSGKTASGWSVGALGAVTGAEEMRFVDTEGARGAAAVEPLTRHAVARVVRELRDGRSGVGLLATAVHRRLDDPRLAFLHAGAYALALDGYHRFAGDSHELRVGILGSHVRGDTAAIRRTQTAPGHYYQRPDAGHVELDPTRTSLSGLSLHARLARIAGPWKYGLSGSATSPGYEVTDLGFNPELDRVQTNAWLRYESYEAGRRLRSWNLGSYVMAQTDVAGQVQELTQDVGFNVQLPSYWGGGVWLMRHQPAWSAHHLRGGPSLRKPGRWMGSFDASSDPRRALSGNGFVFWETEDDTDGHRVSVQVSATLRPSERTSLRAGPSLSFAREAWQHVGAREVAGERRWLVGGLDTRTLGLSTRLDYTMSPTLSLQLYARPFVATVEYDTFRELADPDARAFGDRFLTYALTRSARAGPDLLALDRNADGVPDLELVDPSFTSASVQVNVVLRWEYGPGSALYAVWTHDRDTSGEDRYALGPNLDRLWDTPARNVFMLKASWWVGL